MPKSHFFITLLRNGKMQKEVCMAYKALVTGASGLMGGNLVRHLVKRDFEVYALVRKTSNTMAFEDLPVKKTYGDITDPESLQEAVKGMDYVFHCAAYVSVWTYHEKLMRRVNVDGTRNVVDACIQAGVKRLIHVSTVDAIGFATPDGYGTKEKPSTEEVPYQNDWMKYPYARTKWESQEIVRQAVKEGKLDAVVVNPAFMLGPWDPKPSSGQLILEAVRGGTIAYASGGNNVVDVEDAVIATINALEKGRSGELYILGNENLSYRELFEKVADVLGTPRPRIPLPYPIAWIAGKIGDAYGLATGKEPTICSGLVRLAFLPHYFSPEKARRELNLPATPVEEAIEKAYRWFVDHGYIKPRKRKVAS